MQPIHSFHDTDNTSPLAAELWDVCLVLLPPSRGLLHLSTTASSSVLTNIVHLSVRCMVLPLTGRKHVLTCRYLQLNQSALPGGGPVCWPIPVNRQALPAEPWRCLGNHLHMVLCPGFGHGPGQGEILSRLILTQPMQRLFACSVQEPKAKFRSSAPFLPACSADTRPCAPGHDCCWDYAEEHQQRQHHRWVEAKLVQGVPGHGTGHHLLTLWTRAGSWGESIL